MVRIQLQSPLELSYRVRKVTHDHVFVAELKMRFSVIGTEARIVFQRPYSFGKAAKQTERCSLFDIKIGHVRTQPDTSRKFLERLGTLANIVVRHSQHVMRFLHFRSQTYSLSK